MSLSAAVVDAMVASGCTAKQIAEAVKADLRDAEEKAAERRQLQRIGNRERQQKYRDKSKARNENNAVIACDNALPLSPLEVFPHTPFPNPSIPTPPSPPKGGSSPAKNGNRIGEFEPDIAAAVSIGLSQAQAVAERDKFRDYWTAKAGQAARKLDWPATWRNWCRTAQERQKPPNGNGRGPPRKQTVSEYALELLMENGNGTFDDQFKGNEVADSGGFGSLRLVAIEGG